MVNFARAAIFCSRGEEQHKVFAMKFHYLFNL